MKCHQIYTNWLLGLWLRPVLLYSVGSCNVVYGLNVVLASKGMYLNMRFLVKPESLIILSPWGGYSLAIILI